MTYVGLFKNKTRQRSITMDWKYSKKLYGEYVEWLNSNAGPEGYEWWWKRGDLVGEGIHFKDDAVAIMFRLKFEL